MEIFFESCVSPDPQKHLIGEKKKVKGDQLFNGDQYFSPTNNLTQLKLTLIENFYELLFVLNKNQITETLKKLSYLLCRNLVEYRWVGKGS